MCTMVRYTLEGYIYQEYAWDQSQLRFLSMAVKAVCCKDSSRFQVFIYVGPIRDKTYENLHVHHYTASSVFRRAISRHILYIGDIYYILYICGLKSIGEGVIYECLQAGLEPRPHQGDGHQKIYRAGGLRQYTCANSCGITDTIHF
jgi:hypothetical protein